MVQAPLDLSLLVRRPGLESQRNRRRAHTKKKTYVYAWGRGNTGREGAGLWHSWLFVQARRLACVIPSGGLAGQFLLLASRVLTARATSFLGPFLCPRAASTHSTTNKSFRWFWCWDQTHALAQSYKPSSLLLKILIYIRIHTYIYVHIHTYIHVHIAQTFDPPACTSPILTAGELHFSPLLSLSLCCWPGWVNEKKAVLRWKRLWEGAGEAD